MNKRSFLLSGLASSLTLAWRAAPAAAPANPDAAAMQARWREFLAPDVEFSLSLNPLERSPDEWRKQLSPDSYAVLFEEDTEPPLSSHLNMEKRPGVYVCRACRLPLFTSEMKFESGTGWPSFFTSITKHLATKRDFLLIIPRTEYHCVRCGGHQGHVFDDGPAPTGERWCNNGLALSFVPLKTAR